MTELEAQLDAILEDKMANLKPENLKKGVTCLGIEGTIDLENLLPENIKSGVIINGIEGTYTGGEV